MLYENHTVQKVIFIKNNIYYQDMKNETDKVSYTFLSIFANFCVFIQ